MPEPLTIGFVLLTIAVVGIVFPHVVYPVTLRLIVVLRDLLKTNKHDAVDERMSWSELPRVDILLSAYNEEAVIARCLSSIASSDYPHQQMRLLIGDDGSTDQTVDVVRTWAAEHADLPCEVTVLPRSGKNAVVATLTEKISAPIVVYSDADAQWFPNSLRAIVAPLADPEVGASIGRSRYDVPSEDAMPPSARLDAVASEVSYRKLEEVVHTMEGQIASTIASYGALFALRTTHAHAIRDSRVADDWVNVLRCVAAGDRVAYAYDAATIELRSTSLGGEVRRTIRTAAAGMSTVWQYRKLLLPRAGWFAYFLWGHKVVRWLSPVFLVVLIVALPFLLSDPLVFGVVFYGQAVLYAVALLGYALARQGQHLPLISQATYFVAMNWAFAAAWWRVVRRTSMDRWTPEA